MDHSHKFKIQAGAFIFEGKIFSNSEGMGSYEYNEDSARPSSELDNTLSEIIQKVGQFLKASGSLEKFKIETEE